MLFAFVATAPVDNQAKESSKKVITKRIKRLPGKRISTKSPLNSEYKSLGNGNFNPYNVINLNARLSHKNEEKRRLELLRPTKTTATTKTTTSTINPLCITQVVNVEKENFYPVFTSKDWSPLGK